MHWIWHTFVFQTHRNHWLSKIPSLLSPMSDKAFLYITGLTGPDPLPYTNGLYDRTSETFGGYPVYLKRSDRGRCIAHRNGDWEIKSAARKEADDCILAFVKGGCTLEKCASRVWKVGGPKGYIDQPSVKILLGEEAERQVRGHCGLSRMDTTSLHFLYTCTGR